MLSATSRSSTMPANLRLRPIARSAGPPDFWLSTSDSGESPPKRRSWWRIATSSPSAWCRLSRVAYGSRVATQRARSWTSRSSSVRSALVVRSSGKRSLPSGSGQVSYKAVMSRSHAPPASVTAGGARRMLRTLFGLTQTLGANSASFVIGGGSSSGDSICKRIPSDVSPQTTARCTIGTPGEWACMRSRAVSSDGKYLSSSCSRPFPANIASARARVSGSGLVLGPSSTQKISILPISTRPTRTPTRSVA